MEVANLLAFLGASVLLTLIPGPDTLYVISESIVRGYKAGVAIALGLCTGCIIHTIAAATGVSVVVLQSPIAMALLKSVGALYLTYLAILSFQEKVEHYSDVDTTQNTQNSLIDYARRGFLMNVLNPKVSLFFIAFFPQFIVSGQGSVSEQMLVLGSIFIAQAMLLFSIMALISGYMRVLLKQQLFWHATKWIKVTLFSFLAGSLVWSLF